MGINYFSDGNMPYNLGQLPSLWTVFRGEMGMGKGLWYEVIASLTLIPW